MSIEDIKATTGRVLGVDFGEARTGLALSDRSRLLASAIGTISPGGLEKTAEAIVATATAEGAVGVVIGLPVNMNGSEGPRAERARRLAALVSELAPTLAVALLDERMTTMAASRFLNATDTRGKKRKGVIDTLSAEIILQNALDRIRG